MSGVRKASDEQLSEAYLRTRSVWATAKELGMCGQSVHERLVRMGCRLRNRPISEDEIARIKDEYIAYRDAARLDELAASMGRTKSLICRVAGSLGLTSFRWVRPSHIRAEMSIRMKDCIAKNGHNRGALGMRHTEETKARLAESTRRMMRSLTEEQLAARTLKGMRTKRANGTDAKTNRAAASWKAGWRDVGGKRVYFRSRWEANYARYLEWLKQQGQIAEWEHEPETFWFEAIKRGTRSYLPDFRVTENTGKVVFHEVKGWMDARSKTCLNRMRIYHPSVNVLLIDGKAYESVRRQMAGLIDGWER